MLTSDGIYGRNICLSVTQTKEAVVHICWFASEMTSVGQFKKTQIYSNDI